MTLAAVESQVEAVIETVYVSDSDGDEDDNGALETREFFDGDSIDLGEEVVQQVACAIDPYPRSPGAEVEARWRADGNETGISGPFAALAKVRRDP